MTDQKQLMWNDPAWQKEAHEWIRVEAKKNSIQLLGGIEQPHVYHWSTVMRVPSSEGMLFFKATAGETIYEAALTQKLADWIPDLLPDLIAVDTNRGWMLMRDGGEQLRASIRPTKDVMSWEPVIAKYADLQIGLADHVDEILQVGIPDYRLGVLPSLYSNLLTDKDSMMIGDDNGLTIAGYEKLQKLAEPFELTCEELAAYSIPESINHGDFHDGNVLVKDGRITFFDWGDANITHPFASVRTWFVSMEIALDLEDFAPPTPEMSALLRRYLERWNKYGSVDELMKVYTLSRPVASMVKTLQWRQSISRMENPVRAEYAWIVPEVLREFIYYMELEV